MALARKTTTDMVDADLGLALSRAGGLGLAEILMQAFEQRALSTRPAATAETTGAGSEPAPATAEVTAVMMRPAGSISSALAGEPIRSMGSHASTRGRTSGWHTARLSMPPRRASCHLWASGPVTV